MASLFLGAPPMAAVSMTSQYFSKSQSLFIASSSSTSRLTRPAPLTIICGRGDKKTARGKRFKHSFGNARPRNKDKGRGPPRAPTPPGPPRKFEWYDGDIGDVGEPLDSSKGKGKGKGGGGSGSGGDDDYGYEDEEE